MSVDLPSRLDLDQACWSQARGSAFLAAPLPPPTVITSGSKTHAISQDIRLATTDPHKLISAACQQIHDDSRRLGYHHSPYQGTDLRNSHCRAQARTVWRLWRPLNPRCQLCILQAREFAGFFATCMERAILGSNSSEVWGRNGYIGINLSTARTSVKPPSCFRQPS